MATPVPLALRGAVGFAAARWRLRHHSEANIVWGNWRATAAKALYRFPRRGSQESGGKSLKPLGMGLFEQKQLEAEALIATQYQQISLKQYLKI